MVAEQREDKVDFEELNELDTQTEDNEDFAALLEDSFSEVENGEIVIGRVVEVRREHVVVDIGSKADGIIPLEDYLLPGEPMNIHVGQETPLYIVRSEDRYGAPILSRRRAIEARDMERIRQARESGAAVTCRIVESTKGGFKAYVGSIAGFMPLSHSGVNTRRQEEIDALVGRELEVKVLDIRGRNNVVLSRRALNEERRELVRTTIQEALETGALLKGTVKTITDFGAFVDLGGIDGLLHVQDMAWHHIEHPSAMVQVGQPLEVKVIKIAGDRISLSLKEKTEDPWVRVKDKYPIGARFQGVVTNLASYGAFVELEPGVEGMIHVSELSWIDRINHPKEVLTTGQRVEVVVLDVDIDKRRIALGYKQAQQNPWEQARIDFPPNTIVTGTVTGLQDYGAFVRLPNGLEGMVHVADMSWTKRVKHPKHLVNIGDQVTVAIKEINPETRRISLSMKDAEVDPWTQVNTRYPVGSTVKVKVVKLTDRGAVCELEEGIEGFAHVSTLGTERVSKPSDVLKVGDEVEMQVIKIDRANRKIGLSRKALLLEEERAEVAQYLADDESSGMGTLGDFLREALGRDS